MNDFSIDFLELQKAVSTNLELPSPELTSFYKNLKDRILWIDFDIDDNLLEYSKYIIEWNKEDAGVPVENRTPIKLMIFSYGGSLDACNHFIDIIKLSKTPIFGYNLGVAMSAGLLIFVACDKKFCTKKSTALIHQGSSQVAGVAGDVIQNVENYKRQLKDMQTFIVENTKITDAIFKKHMKVDWYISSDEQVKLGISDGIIQSLSELF